MKGAEGDLCLRCCRTRYIHVSVNMCNRINVIPKLWYFSRPVYRDIKTAEYSEINLFVMFYLRHYQFMSEEKKI